MLGSLWGCRQEVTYQTVAQNNQYQLEVPSYMHEEKQKKLSPTADFQYCSYYRNVYTIVNEIDSVDAPLASVATQRYDDLVSALQKPQRIDSLALEINGLPALQISVAGDVGPDDLKERIYYRLIFIAKDNKIYEIVLWGWDRYRDKFLNDFNRIQQSFKVL